MNEQHIIAEFMGLTHEEKTITAPHGSFNDITYTVYYDDSREVQLKYKYSWDALIPVINKLNNNFDLLSKTSMLNNESFQMNYLPIMGGISEDIINNNIEDCFHFVIEGIEYYNQIIEY